MASTLSWKEKDMAPAIGMNQAWTRPEPALASEIRRSQGGLSEKRDPKQAAIWSMTTCFTMDSEKENLMQLKTQYCMALMFSQWKIINDKFTFSGVQLNI